LGAASIALASLANSAAAEPQLEVAEVESAEAVAIELDAPAECPAAADFFTAVRARTAHIEASNGNENERRFQIVVRKEPGGFSGQLSIVERAEEGAPRTVHARTCAEVFDVLSLIAAVAVDPAAARVSLPPAASEPEVQAVLETPVASTPLEPTLAPPTITEKNTAIEPSPTASPRTAFALGGNLSAASSPNILASGTLFAESKRR